MFAGLIVQNKLGNFYLVFGRLSEGVGAVHFKVQDVHPEGFIQLDNARSHMISAASARHAVCAPQAKPFQLPVDNMNLVKNATLSLH